MEFAFSALLLLLLLLPGFILQTAYTKGRWSWNSPTLNRPLTEQIPTGIIGSAALHLLWFPLATQFESIDLKVLVMFLLGDFGHDEEHFTYALGALTRHPYKIALYFLTLFVFAAIVGTLARGVVRGAKWDHKYKFFRFSNNEWYYWLSGEITRFKETPDVEGEIRGVYLTTVVHHGDADYLYTGYVIDYYFDRDGNLDRIILDEATRRKLADDQPAKNLMAAQDDTRYYEIVGHYFVLRYSEMTTINLEYLVFQENENAVTQVTIPESDVAEART